MFHCCCFDEQQEMESDEDLARINKLIEKEIADEKKKMKSRVKILLLGCGEAGKSTFIKQMKIINAEKEVWTTEEREQFRLVRSHCIELEHSQWVVLLQKT